MPTRATTNAFTIIIDTREQTPYTFEGIRDRHAPRSRPGQPAPFVKVRTHRAKLDVGDYGVILDNGWNAQVIVERKTLADLYQTLGKERDRFEREVELANELNIQLHLVVESDFAGLMRVPSHVRQVTARTITGTLASWSIRFPWLHAWTPGPREAAEKWTYRLLEFAAENCAKATREPGRNGV